LKRTDVIRSSYNTAEYHHLKTTFSCDNPDINAPFAGIFMILPKVIPIREYRPEQLLKIFLKIGSAPYAVQGNRTI
jgi:hypothetical protein